MAWHGKFRPGLLLLLISFVVISEATAKALGNSDRQQRGIYSVNRWKKKIRYDTAYACEGKILKIECRDGEIIQLIRANYGRFSITICNDNGNTDWSVDCMSQKSLRVLHSKCTHNQNCSILASTSMFGDPCAGTHKYLEAHYQCIPATTTTTTSRPSPPWLITAQPPMWSTPKAATTIKPSRIIPPSKVSSTSLRPTTSTTKSSSLPQQVSSFVTQPMKSLPPPHIKDIINHLDQIPKEITTLPYTTVSLNSQEFGGKVTSFDGTQDTSMPSILPSWGRGMPDPTDYCSPVTVRSIYWSWTKVNSTTIQPCPGGTTGFAKWHCQMMPNADYPQWYPVNPDLSECRSVWLTSLEQRIVAGQDPLTSITNDLAQVTSRKTLYGGDMMITTKIIQKMTGKLNNDIQTIPDTRQREQIVTEMLMDVANTSSNLLDESQHSSWKDLSYKEQMSVATSLLIGLEENAFLLADTVMTKKTVDREFKNILLSVRVLDIRSLTVEKFPSDDFKSEWHASNDTIELPKGPLLENSDGNLVRLVFVAFDHLEEILQWQPDTTTNDLGNSNNVSKILNSKVISASLGNGKHIQLKEPVKLTLKHLKTENVSNPKCVFWDYTINAWSEEGCHVEETLSNLTHTVCYCDHLTNFAILMDVHAIYLPVPHEIALQIITYVGCVISIICLILAIITFQLFRGLKSDRTTIHCNLCLCLLTAEIIFLVGIGQTENRIVCGVIAGFLQYFFLCAFVWMFFEGFQLYVMLIEVFEAEKSRLCWYYFFAYSLPFFIVFISATMYPQGYGTQRHCWLQTDNYFIYSFVGPVIIVILLNLIFLSMAIIMMCKHASNSVSLKNKEHSRLASSRTWLKGAFVLVFLLGLTWTFGFLYLNKESVAMAYLFSSLNSLQGFFIFLFHCIKNEKVRKEYRKFIRMHSWLPKCLRCTKPSEGGSSSSGSSGIAKERRTSIQGGPNSNQSGGSNSHSTENSVLSPHHGTTSLQRNWNSQSCTNVNRVCKTPVPTSTSANMAATLCHPTRATITSPSPYMEPNTSTLPSVPNNCHYLANNSPNIPKSLSIWGPLHKSLHWKNISFKSCSRDSGHGGSEQEDSPKSHVVVTDPSHMACSSKDIQQMLQDNHNFEEFHRQQHQEGTMQATANRHLTLPPGQSNRKKNNNGANVIPNHWSHHTYTEIYNGQSSRGLFTEDDPVYEEIDRNEVQFSDMSDEDGRRQSDMSRQSSRSYGDHRPLIPYSPRNDKSFLDTISNKHYNTKEACGHNNMDSFHRRQNNKKTTSYWPNMDAGVVHSLAAVLDGETVVCHLEPPGVYQPDDPSTYVSRTLVLPPHSES